MELKEIKNLLKQHYQSLYEIANTILNDMQNKYDEWDKLNIEDTNEISDFYRNFYYEFDGKINEFDDKYSKTAPELLVSSGYEIYAIHYSLSFKNQLREKFNIICQKIIDRIPLDDKE